MKKIINYDWWTGTAYSLLKQDCGLDLSGEMYSEILKCNAYSTIGRNIVINDCD